MRQISENCAKFQTASICGKNMNLMHEWPGIALELTSPRILNSSHSAVLPAQRFRDRDEAAALLPQRRRRSASDAGASYHVPGARHVPGTFWRGCRGPGTSWSVRCQVRPALGPSFAGRDTAWFVAAVLDRRAHGCYRSCDTGLCRDARRNTRPRRRTRRCPPNEEHRHRGGTLVTGAPRTENQITIMSRGRSDRFRSPPEPPPTTGRGSSVHILESVNCKKMLGWSKSLFMNRTRNSRNL